MRASGLIRPGTLKGADAKHQWVRFICIAVVLFEIPFGIGFYRQSTWAIELWPVLDVRMTYISFASIVATTAALFAWVAWRNEPGALPVVGLVAATATPPIGLYLIWVGVDRGDTDITSSGIVTIAAGLASVAFSRRAGRAPVEDPRPLPNVFRWSFVGFCGVLLPVGIALMLQVEGAFPWKPSPENSTVIGFIFLSAAALFAWIVAHPKWAYGEMALTSFLAYDLVLFVPYLDLWRNRNDTAVVTSYYGGDPSYVATPTDNGINEWGLAFYLAVLTVSAILAVGIHVWGYRTRPVVQPAMGD